MSYCTKPTKEEEREARENLNRLLNDDSSVPVFGTTIWTICRHVSKSGMRRHIDLYVMKRNEPVRITYYVGRILGYREPSGMGKQGLIVDGCGMDMGFHLVHDLSYALHGHVKTVAMAFANTKPGYTFLHRWI